VRQYQIYSIDQNGMITGNREIEAENDDEAIFAVRSMQRPLNTEVWYSDRRIGRIPGVPRLSAPGDPAG
jgi:hypothetical protein